MHFDDEGTLMPVWTHKVEPEAAHPVDPHYAANGLPAYWACHTCREPILLDGKAPPLTVPSARARSVTEPAMSSQP